MHEYQDHHFHWYCSESQILFFHNHFSLCVIETHVLKKGNPWWLSGRDGIYHLKHFLTICPLYGNFERLQLYVEQHSSSTKHKSPHVLHWLPTDRYAKDWGSNTVSIISIAELAVKIVIRRSASRSVPVPSKISLGIIGVFGVSDSITWYLSTSVKLARGMLSREATSRSSKKSSKASLVGARTYNGSHS